MSARALLAFAALAVASAAVAPAHAAGIIHACISNQTGGMRVVNPPATCKPNETSVAWNIQGPQGPQGQMGPPGQPGAPGQPATIPQNLTTLSNNLSTTGVAALGATYFHSDACANMNTGDIILSVNGYGTGALPADGRLLPINGNTALFSLVGTTFGGDGKSNFALPDLRPFAPYGLQYSICAQGMFPARN